VVGALDNNGLIDGGQTGILNTGTIGSVVNTGTITGSNYAINSTGGNLGNITNTGVIDGNIRVTGQDLTITGDSGTGQGTLTGGEITLDPTATLTFGGGNILLAMDIDPLSVVNNANLTLNTTQTIYGDFTQTSAGNLDVGINASGASGQLVVVPLVDNNTTIATGTATLAGGLSATFGSDVSVNGSKRYTVLTSAGGISGTFNSFTTNLTGLTLAQSVISYDANDVYVGFQANYTTAAANQNQTAVASGLQTAFYSSPSAAGQTILNSLNVASTSQAQSTFNSLSGEGISAQQSVNFEATELVVDTARRQSTYWLMDECQTGASSKKNKAAGQNSVPTTCAGETNKKFRSWIAGVGGSSSMDGSSSVGSASVSTRTGGGIVGFDYEVSSHLLVGGMVGGTSSNYNVSARASSGNDSSGQVGLYSVAKWEKLYVNTVFNYGYFSGDSTRYVSGVGSTAEQTATTSSNAFTGRMEVGYRMDHPLLNVMPFIAMQATSLQMNSFKESNTDNLGLSVSGNTTMSEPGSLGVQLDRAFEFNEKWSVYPLIRMAWVHEFQTNRSINASLQALPTANWTVNGASAAPNSANVGISFQAMNKNGMAIFASGDVDASSTTQSYMGQVGFKLLW
jgi:outer membrane autotransporter protein